MSPQEVFYFVTRDTLTVKTSFWSHVTLLQSPFRASCFIMSPSESCEVSNHLTSLPSQPITPPSCSLVATHPVFVCVSVYLCAHNKWENECEWVLGGRLCLCGEPVQVCAVCVWQQSCLVRHCCASGVCCLCGALFLTPSPPQPLASSPAGADVMTGRVMDESTVCLSASAAHYALHRRKQPRFIGLWKCYANE